MIEYFEQLTQEEQEDLTDVIRLLYRQTFLLERKFDKRAGRLQYQREYRICEKHIDFLKMYFQIAGITLCENVHLGLIYIQDEMVWGEKLPRLATIYILLLKQLIEPLDVLEELNESTRLLIYPCIHAVLQGDAVREVLESFGSSREEEEETLGDIG